MEVGKSSSNAGLSLTQGGLPPPRAQGSGGSECTGTLCSHRRTATAVPPGGACSKHLKMEGGAMQAVRTSLAKNESSLTNNTDNDERSKLRNLDASNSSTTGGNTGNTKPMQLKKNNLPEGSTSKEGFMIAIDTSKTSIVDSLVSIAAAEASFVPGRWERSFRRLGKEGEGSMGL